MAIKIFPKNFDGHVEAENEEDLKIIERWMIPQSGRPAADPTMVAQHAEPSRKRSTTSPEIRALIDVLTRAEHGGLSFIKKEVKALRSSLNKYLEANHGQGIDRVFGPLKKKITTAGLKVEDLFSTEAKGYGVAKTTTYVAGPLLLTADEF